MEYDYIIVGAGAGGCVLADCLSRDPRVQVLVIESGGLSRNPLINVPKGFYFLIDNPRYTYAYPTTPVSGAERAEVWRRGRLVGGSTAINGLIWNRGGEADYDAIESNGNPGWGWKDMLSSFRAIEDHQLGASPTRGTGGPVGVSVIERSEAVTDALLEAAATVGWQRMADVNEGDDERVGFSPGNIKRGVRVSAARAFLRPALGRRNLTLADRTVASTLLLDGQAVVGVRAARRGSTRDYKARREVILAAGAIESPLLLERSGIGDPEVLARASVDPKVESPNVGRRMIEHRGIALQARLRANLGQNRLLNSRPKQLVAGIGYLLDRRGPLSLPAYDLISFFKSSPDQPRPDLQGIWTPFSLDLSASRWRLAKGGGLMFLGYQLRPTTQSSVHISGPSPDSAPIVEARYLETDEDRRAMGRMLELARGLLAQSPIADLIVEEELPGPAVSSAEETLRYSRETGGGLYHAVGSCGMGPGTDDVLDHRLRVRGLEGLRVVDAGSFPQMPSGNTTAPVMALAWRAAQLIRSES